MQQLFMSKEEMFDFFMLELVEDDYYDEVTKHINDLAKKKNQDTEKNGKEPWKKSFRYYDDFNFNNKPVDFTDRDNEPDYMGLFMEVFWELFDSDKEYFANDYVNELYMSFRFVESFFKAVPGFVRMIKTVDIDQYYGDCPTSYYSANFFYQRRDGKRFCLSFNAEAYGFETDRNEAYFNFINTKTFRDFYVDCVYYEIFEKFSFALTDGDKVLLEETKYRRRELTIEEIHFIAEFFSSNAEQRKEIIKTILMEKIDYINKALA